MVRVTVFFLRSRETILATTAEVLTRTGSLTMTETLLAWIMSSLIDVPITIILSPIAKEEALMAALFLRKEVLSVVEIWRRELLESMVRLLEFIVVILPTKPTSECRSTFSLSLASVVARFSWTSCLTWSAMSGVSVAEGVAVTAKTGKAKVRLRAMSEAIIIDFFIYLFGEGSGSNNT